MNREEKTAVIEDVAREIDSAEAIFAVDYRGISVKQSAELRARLADADARFRIVKNRLTVFAADQAGAEPLKPLLEGPTALTFVRGDAAVAAKALAAFRREHGLLEFKGGTLDGQTLTRAEIEAISRLPARDVLYGQLVGLTATPVTGLVRGLAGLIGGLASQLGQIRDQGLLGGAEDAPAGGAEDAPAAEPEDAAAEKSEDDADTPEAGEASEPSTSGEDATPADEAPGDPVAEAATAEQEEAEAEKPAEEAGEDNE
jgi:large subunit ribosomal protein L10